MKKTEKIIGWGLFAVYAAVMLYLLFFERIGVYYPEELSEYFRKVRNNVQIVPFRTIIEYIGVMQDFSVFNTGFVNLAGNIAMFVPLGVFLPLLFPKLRKFRPFILTFALIIVCVELIQAFTLLGSADIDDLILNAAGGCVGFAVFKIFIRIKHKEV
mgnify:CR=1 FL=1